MLYSRVACSLLKTTFGVPSGFAIRNFSCTRRQAMRFVQYKDGSGQGLGIQVDDGKCIVSLSADQSIPVDMVSFLQSQYSIENVQK